MQKKYIRYKGKITGKYKNKYNNFIIGKPIPKTFLNIELVSDTQLLLNKLFTTILQKNQKFSMRWIIGLERYVSSLNSSIKPFSEHLRRGNIVEVELFGHFNTELTFLHPAVVLYNRRDRVLIAPISTSNYQDSNPLHIDVGVTEGLKHNCGISLDEIYMINKDRIAYKHTDSSNQTVKLPDVILNKIDELISENFMPEYYKTFQKNKEDLEEARKRIKELENQIQKKQKVPN